MKREEFNAKWLPFCSSAYRVACYILESEADAEDAAQEVFLKLWDRRDALESIASPEAYVVTMVRNHCLDILRRRKARGEGESLDGIQIASGQPPDRSLSEKEDLMRTMKMIDRLPERQRQIIRLRVLEEKDYDEIEKIMGLSKIHLRVLLSMARKTLRAQDDEKN